MKIFHNPRCSKSRQTLELLEQKRDDIEIIHYLNDVPSKAELKRILKMLGMQAKDLVRKNENIYKSDFKGKDLSESQWLEALVKHPKLIERPIVVHDGKAVIGRPPENVFSLID